MNHDPVIPLRRAHIGKLHVPGFTLVEIVITMAIIASALMAVLAVVPTGMDVSRSAMDHSVVATILEDISQRLQGEKLQVGPPAFSPAYFDEFGNYLRPDLPSDELALKRVYRADIHIDNINNPPPHTSGLKAATIKLAWPLKPNGEPIESNQTLSVTWGVTTLSGPDWQLIDPNYEPKIGL